VGMCVAGMFVPGLGPRTRAAAALAAAGAAGFGAYDDLSGNGEERGLRGHFGALSRGRITTGLVKVVGIGATGLAAAALLRRGPVDTLMDGALIAAGANLVNLFDLRPGRATKFVLLMAGPALFSSAAPLLGPAVGASIALLPDELAERSMLGDAGANALGAALGVAAVAQVERSMRAALLGGVLALTLARERTSFSRIIDRVPPRGGVDLWGRCVCGGHGVAGCPRGWGDTRGRYGRIAHRGEHRRGAARRFWADRRLLPARRRHLFGYRIRHRQPGARRPVR